MEAYAWEYHQEEVKSFAFEKTARIRVSCKLEYQEYEFDLFKIFY